MSAARTKAATRAAAAAPDAASILQRQVDWQPSLRLIASRYPTVGLYDAIADPADLEVVFAIESLTNPRLRDEAGQLQLVPPDERVSGAGSTPIMAAFTHLNPEGSRFCDGTCGVYYAARELDTAIAEVSHHRAVFLARTQEPAIDIDLRLIAAVLSAPLHDLRAWREKQPSIYDPQHYGVSQRLGLALRVASSWGVLYHSVRHRGGLCVGVFRPKALKPAREAAHIALHWDGRRITHWYEKRTPQALQEAG